MFCKNCGKELPDTAKFCGSCGTPVAPAVPEEALDSQPEIQQSAASVEVPETQAAPEIPETQAAPEIPETQAASEIPVTQAVPEIPAAQTAAEIPVPETGAAEEIPAAIKRRGKSGLIVIGGIAVVAILAVVLVVKLVGGLLGGGGGGSRTQAFAYLTDRDELMYLSDLKEKTEAIEVSDKDDPGRVQFTKDGKTLYYQDNDNTLYKIAVSELKKGSRPERVARDVSRYRILDNGTIVYGKRDSNSGTYEVTCVTSKEDFRLVKECNNYRLGEDQKNLYYTEYDEDDNVYTLYKIALKKDAKEEELLDGYSNLYTDWDASLLVYDEDDSDPDAGWSDDADRNTRTVYSCKPGGDPTELVDDVYAIYGVTVDGSKVNFYYTEEEVEKYTLYDLVTDKKASDDAATLATDLVKPDWSNNYYPYNIFFENGAWYYETRSGERFEVDRTALIGTYGSAGDDLRTYEVRDIASNAAQARYNEVQADYEAKRDIYNEARDRERIRENLKSSETNQRSLVLYHYNNSAPSDSVATDINQNQWVTSAKDGVFLYKKAAGNTGGKVGDVSDEDIYEKVYSGGSSSDDDWYQLVGDTESVLEFDEDVTAINGMEVLNGKEVVLSLSYLAGSKDNQRTERILNAYTIDKTALTFSTEVAEDEFSSVKKVTDAKDNDALYFFNEVESKDRGTRGDLNKYSNGKVETVAKEIYAAVILEDGTIYAATDVSKKGEAELSLIQGDKPTVITDELTGDTVFLDSKQLLYIADEDLYLWDGKAERQIAKGVSAIWANSEMNYDSLAPSGGNYGGGYGDYGYGYNDYGSAAGGATSAVPW